MCVSALLAVAAAALSLGGRLPAARPPAWAMMAAADPRPAASAAAADTTYVPETETEVEIKIKNSRFIGTAGHTTSPEEARAFIRRIQERYPDASHWCYAFAIGHGASVTQGMSDAGEPSGTAGKPILNVLMGSGLGDCTVVVTRYFGGTKLGTGGLVKAYTQGAQAVLAAVRRRPKVALARLAVTVAYDLHPRCRALAERVGATVEAEAFEEAATLMLAVGQTQAEQLERLLVDVTRGNISIGRL
eukprot:EG_transcript_21008